MLQNLHRQISNSSNNLILKAPEDVDVIISEMQLIVKLPSLTEMPLYSDDPILSEEQRDALFWAAVNQAENKKVACFWNDKRILEFIIFRREPYYVENLITRYTSLPTFTLQAGASLSLAIEATNTGLLGTGDSLTVWGQVEFVGI